MSGSSLTYKLSGIEQTLEYTIADVAGTTKYLIENIRVQDNNNTSSRITMQVRSYGTWTPIKLLS
jgi:hypothetical protein